LLVIASATPLFPGEIDSPVEKSGFEPSVPPVNELVSPAGTRMRTRRHGRSRGVVYVAGTKGSNPLSSSGESASSSGPRRRASRLRRSNGGGPQVTRRRGSVTSDRSGAAIICNIIFAQRTETDPAPQKIGRLSRRGCVVSCSSAQGKGA
jgi:hypothetical protein